MAYCGGRGGGGGGWFGGGRGGGSGGGRFPWGRGDGAGVGRGRGRGPGETLAAVMARRAPLAALIRPEAMRAAEEAAREVVLRVHPTEEAEQRRQDVIGYAKRLIGTSLGCEVFAFGSVPLKTYLPDGDVDVTVLGNTSLDSTFINDVRSVLESEVQNSDAEFELKGLQFINAEVKLIKCVIENIVVDISFNQIGGVSTLCFLEMVDQEVGKNHLFKRSIILIKTWCYHESRILGAHHGLISTYALETLVLYIFNLFHKSLHGPLEALYKFLEYFSKFDWENYCISLNGPVALSSLPNLTDEPTAIHDELLLGKEFGKGPLDRLLVLPKDSDGWNAKFRLKHLNIIDPLKGNNNLGRSVSKGSFYRIRSAFSFGAQKLGQILMLPSELIPDQIYGFFANTLERHGKGERPDLGNGGSFQSLLSPENSLSEDLSDLENSYMDENENRSPDNSLELPDKEPIVNPNMHKTSSRYLPGDAQDRPWNKIWFTKSAADYDKIVSGASFSAKSSHLASFRSHSSFSPENGDDNIKQCCKDSSTEEDLPLSRSFMQQQIYANNPSHILTSSTRTNTLDVSNSCPANESNWTDLHEEKLLLSFFSPNLLDLSGDLDLHLGCLRKVQYHLESLFDGFLQSVKEASLAGVLDEDSFKIPTVSFLSNYDARPPGLSLASSTDTERRNLSPVYCSHSTGDVSQQSHDQVQVNAVCQQNVALSPPPSANSENYPVSWPYITGDIPKTRGTGTYIPKMSYDTYKERMSSEKGRKLKPKLPDRLLNIQINPSGNLHQYNSFELGCSGPSNEHIAVESATNQILMTQNNSQQDIYSSKSSVPKGGFVSTKEQASTYSGTKQIPTSQSLKVQNSQHRYVCSNMNTIDNQKSDINEGLVRPGNGSREAPISHPPKLKSRQKSPSSPRLVLPHYGGNGQGNLPLTNTCQASSPATKGFSQIKAQQEDNLEFGSLGPFSLRFLSEKFSEAFPPLPTRKGPTEVPASTIQNPRPGATQSRPQGFYQLRDEADFPPLQAGCR